MCGTEPVPLRSRTVEESFMPPNDCPRGARPYQVPYFQQKPFPNSFGIRLAFPKRGGTFVVGV
jgi:hypothetical protein